MPRVLSGFPPCKHPSFILTPIARVPRSFFGNSELHQRLVYYVNFCHIMAGDVHPAAARSSQHPGNTEPAGDLLPNVKLLFFSWRHDAFVWVTVHIIALMFVSSSCLCAGMWHSELRVGWPGGCGGWPGGRGGWPRGGAPRWDLT